MKVSKWDCFLWAFRVIYLLCKTFLSKQQKKSSIRFEIIHHDAIFLIKKLGTIALTHIKICILKTYVLGLLRLPDVVVLTTKNKIAGKVHLTI